MEFNPEMIKSAAGSIGGSAAGGGDASWDDIYAQQANSFTQYIDNAKDQELLKNGASVGTSAPVQTEEKETKKKSDDPLKMDGYLENAKKQEELKKKDASSGNGVTSGWV